VRAVLVEMRARTIKRMDMGESLMLARLEAMSPEARVAFVARLNRGVERFERHLGDHRPRGPGPEGPGADD
jgi:hypothetical protein